MSDVAWMKYQRKSQRVFVSDPRAAPEVSRSAMTRYEQAFAAVAAPKKPNWFRWVAKHWYLTYVPPMVIVYFLLARLELATVPRIISAVVIGVAAASLIAIVVTAVARGQAEKTADTHAATVATADKNRTVRVLPERYWVSATAVLDADPTQEETVHRLVWRIAAVDDVRADADASSAADQLLDLEHGGSRPADGALNDSRRRQSRRAEPHLDESSRRSLRPIPVAFGFGVVLCFVAGVLSGAAPDWFQRVGGWVTTVILVGLTVVLASLLSVWRTNARNRP